MPDNTPVFLTNDAARRTRACVIDFERRPPTPRAPKNRRGRERPPIRAILLEDLPSGGTADAAVTVRVSSPAIQKVSLLGYWALSMTFQLQFKGKATKDIPWKSTAAALQTILEAVETIGKGNVSVALGDIPATADGSGEKFPGVWLVSFIGSFLARDPAKIPLLQTVTPHNDSTAVVEELEQYADTGSVEQVTANTPVGNPTPMRAGAVVTAIQFPGEGYCVQTCEARNFGSPY